MAVKVDDLKFDKIDTKEYITTELNIMNRFKAKNATSAKEWIDKYAVSYYEAIKKLKTLNIEILESEIYKRSLT